MENLGKNGAGRPQSEQDPDRPLTFDKSQLPKADTKEFLSDMEHVLIRGQLPRAGTLFVGEEWAGLSLFGGQNYEFEMKRGWPVVIRFPAIGAQREFYPIIDNQSRDIVGVHIGRISRERFQSLSDVTVITKLTEGGKLILGGQKVNPGSEEKSQTGFRAVFESHGNERVRVLVRNGIIERVSSMESDLDAHFALIWDRRQQRNVDSFYRSFSLKRFNSLDDGYEIHNLNLTRSGRLNLASRRWLNLGHSYGGQPVDIVSIKNPTGKEAFIIAVRAQNGYMKILTQVYELNLSAPRRSFSKGNLLKVFDNWRPTEIRDLKDRQIRSYILSTINISESGDIEVGGYRGRFPAYKGAEVELMVINGRKRYVKFVKDRHGKPILDKGKSLVIDLEADIKGQIEGFKQRNNLELVLKHNPEDPQAIEDFSRAYHLRQLKNITDLECLIVESIGLAPVALEDLRKAVFGHYPKRAPNSNLTPVLEKLKSQHVLRIEDGDAGIVVALRPVALAEITIARWVKQNLPQTEFSYEERLIIASHSQTLEDVAIEIDLPVELTRRYAGSIFRRLALHDKYRGITTVRALRQLILG